MSYPIGTRVVAIRDADKEEVRIFGYGIYSGDEIPPPNIIGPFFTNLNAEGMTNPKIVLDDGGVVWGCECWWGSEGAAEKKFIQGRRVVTVPLPERATPADLEAMRACEETGEGDANG